MPREEVHRYKAEIDHHSMRQQMDQMRAAIGVSMQMQSPSMTQNVMGAVGAGSLGYNTLTSDLRSMGGGLAAMMPNPNAMMAPSSINMSLSSSIMGSMGMGSPNTMYSRDYQKLASEDLKTRMSRTAASAGLSAAEFAVDWGPNIAFGAAAIAAGGGAADAAWSGTFGLWNWGWKAGAGGMLGSAAVGYAAGKIKDQVGSQSRYENMLMASSRGKLGFGTRSAMARGMRETISDTAGIDFQGGAEVLAYGTEAGILKATQDTEEFGKNYKSLIKATQTIMKTFHQSIKDAVGTMAQMKQSGIFNIEEYGSNAMLMKARAEVAGISPGQMFGIQQQGAQMGRGTIGAASGREASTFGVALAGGLVTSGAITQERLHEITGAGGAAGVAALGMGLTSGAISMLTANGAGVRIMAGLRGADGKLDKSFIDKLSKGDSATVNELLMRGAGRISKLDAATYKGQAMEDLKTLSVDENINLVLGMAKSKWDSLGKDPNKMNKFQMKEMLRVVGLTDEKDIELYSKIHENPELINRVRRSQRMKYTNNKLKNIKEEAHWTNKLSTMTDRAGNRLATPFLEFGEDVKIGMDRIFGVDDIAEFAGGDINAAKDLVVPDDRVWFADTDPNTVDDLFEELWPEMKRDRGMMRETFDYVTGGKVLGVFDYMTGGKHDDWEKSKTESMFKGFLKDNAEYLTDVMSPKNVERLNTDPGYRKLVKSKLESMAPTPKMADTVLGMLTKGKGSRKRLSRSINTTRVLESMENIKGAAKVVYDQISKGEFEGAPAGLEYYTYVASEDGIDLTEIKDLQKYMQSLDIDKIQGTSKDTILHLKEAVTALLSGKGLDTPKSRGADAKNESFVQALPIQMNRIVTAVETIAEKK